jgi:dTDP-4-amino-4,6-dideoxygalactose transaminase
MLSVPLVKPDLPTLEDIREPLAEVLANGRITNFGKYVQEFERETAAYLGTDTVTISSGTTGLTLALSALCPGLEGGGRVIIPSFTFIATAQAVINAGAAPLFADIDDNLSISVSDVEQLLSDHPDVRAVIAVHMYGLPAAASELERVIAAASSRLGRKIALVFDAAHAFGAAVGGKRIGGFGDAEVFSLSATKPLVSGEGGLISSNDPQTVRTIRSMRNYGFAANYNAEYRGTNGKMSELHAIVGLFNLRRIDVLLEARRQKARRYREQIEGSTRFRTIFPLPGSTHTFKDFTIQMPEGVGLGARAAVIRDLAKKNIEARAYFDPPVHEQSRFRRYVDRPLPKTEMASRRVITLPFFTSISDDEIDYVTAALRQADETME